MAMPKEEWRGFLARWLALSAVLIGIAAVQSDGYHHPDEYFQTLEFAGTKLGRTPVGDLPWEHALRIRSWLQPGLYVAMARSLDAVGIHDPFAWALAFRLASGLLAWVAVAALCLVAPRLFPEPEARSTAVMALCLAWFVPYLSVRTSSENLSGSCLMIGISLLLWSLPADDSASLGPPRPLVSGAVGLLFGLAFELRFATAIVASSMAAWAIFVARLPLRRLVWAAAGVLAALGLGACVDRWGYGSWVFPAYEYLYENMAKGVAARRFGSLPPYGYLVLGATGPAAPLVAFAMAAAVVAWVRKPWNPLTWATAPFVVAHSLVSHKEMRFLFPIALATPFLCVLALAPSGDRWDGRTRVLWRARRGLAGRALLALNLLALAVFSLTPTRPQLSFQRFVRSHHPRRFEAYMSTPFSPWETEGLNMYFYRPDALVLRQVADVAGAEEHGEARFLLVTEALDPAPSRARGYTCVARYRAFPSWLPESWLRALERVPAWDLYECVRRSGTR
jgi:phosphatidylinositol glycan class B